MKEIKKLDVSILRGICIENNYYTEGTNEEYENLLFEADKIENCTLEDFKRIAEDIKIHSNTSDEIIEIVNRLNYSCRNWIEE